MCVYVLWYVDQHWGKFERNVERDDQDKQMSGISVLKICLLREWCKAVTVVDNR